MSSSAVQVQVTTWTIFHWNSVDEICAPFWAIWTRRMGVHPTETPAIRRHQKMPILVAHLWPGSRQSTRATGPVQHRLLVIIPHWLWPFQLQHFLLDFYQNDFKMSHRPEEVHRYRFQWRQLFKSRSVKWRPSGGWNADWHNQMSKAGRVKVTQQTKSFSRENVLFKYPRLIFHAIRPQFRPSQVKYDLKSHLGLKCLT